MSVDQERIEEIASSIADQLCSLYPNDIPEDDTDVKQYLQNLLDSLRQSDTDKDSFSRDYEELLSSIDVAVQKWKSNDKRAEPQKAAATSFSLLDQLQGGFAPPVAVEEILEAPSVAERLTIFKKINYVEDLLADWKEFRPILRTDLQTSDSTAFECLQLHRKWFDQGRSSTEYLGLQYDLCQNLMDAIVTHFVSSEISAMEDNLLVDLIQNWHDMFLDVMQSGHYSRDLAENMEVSMMFLLRNISSQPSEEEEVEDIIPVHILALIDTQAKWFRSWADHVSPQYLVSLLERTEILPDLIVRCRIKKNDSPSQSSVSNEALRLQSVAILASIIGRTRVPLFPWYLLSQTLSTPLNTDDMQNPKSIESLSPNTGFITHSESKDPSSAELGSVLEIFLTAVPYEAKVEWTRTCFNVIELILRGSKTVDNAIFDHLLSTVESHLEVIVKDANLEQAALLSEALSNLG
jgi:hypothetical protein